MWEHILYCGIDFITTPWKAGASAISLAVGILLLLRINTKKLALAQKIVLAYAQIAAFAFPIVLFVFTMACKSFNMHCDTILAQRILYAIPATFALSLVSGFVLIPALYRLSERTFEIKGGMLLKIADANSKKLNMPTPRLFQVDAQKPAAFSFSSLTPSVFLSIGLSDLLNQKEIEAVIIHELAHVKHNSSALKASSIFLNLLPFSILRSFGADMNIEEKKADNVVAEIQGTREHLDSAKRKFDSYEKNKPSK